MKFYIMNYLLRLLYIVNVHNVNYHTHIHCAANIYKYFINNMPATLHFLD